jgi:ABC-2 type transport system permease protein
VNWEHLKAFLWLRWRLIANRNKRAGALSVIMQAIMTTVLIGGGIVCFFGGILTGYFALPKAPPAIYLFAWDAVVIGFLFLWGIELLLELQRSELLSLDKFMHLPVSLNSAFLINYVGSITGMGAIFFFPLMLGLAIGLVFSKGPLMLLLFPLIFGFIVMVTAVTYQFKGWLASLMVNQRRRRTVITVITFVFIAMFQLPNLIGFASSRMSRNDVLTDAGKANQKAIEKLDRQLAAKEISKAEHRQKVHDIRGGSREEQRQQIYEVVRLVNTFVPLGWLPFGAAEAFDGKPWMPLAGMAGLALIGGLSLRRSYRTTLRLYTGDFTGKSSATTTPSSSPKVKPAETGAMTKSGKYRAAFLERQIPRISEHASAIAVSSFRSMMRAPETKMMLLSPVIMIIVFGGVLFTQRANTPELVRPLMVVGGFTFMLFMIVGILGNQFGFDRSGFRVFVLSPAPRKDILLGKNLCMVPFGIGFMFIIAVSFQLLQPMRVDHYLAILLQMIPMYLIYCLVGNVLSIIAPLPMSPGSMKPMKPKGMVILIHLAFMFVFPIALAPTLIPLGIEFLLTWVGNYTWVPAYLVCTVAEVALVVWAYFRILGAEGDLLARREQKILEAVTAKVE